MSETVPSQLEARQSGVREAFQRLSYLQYPAMLVALGYMFKSAIAMPSVKGDGWAVIFDDWNYALLYAGVGIGLSSLQDPTKTQNEMSRKVWRDPRKGRWMLLLLAFYTLSAIVAGLIGAYLSKDKAMNQLSLGLVAFGLGMIGLLKTAIEMREHHRLDKQTADTPQTVDRNRA